MMLQYPETTQHEPILQEKKHWCVKCHKTFRTKRGLAHRQNISKQCCIPKEAETHHNIPILCPNDDCDRILQTKHKRRLLYHFHIHSALKKINALSTRKTHHNSMIQNGEPKEQPEKQQKHTSWHENAIMEMHHM